MNLSVGIVGLANVGKSTLLNALLKKQVAVSANYPFTTIEPNVGVVEVPDSRLQFLARTIAGENSKSETRNSKQIPTHAKASAGGQNSNDQKSKEILNQVQNDRDGWPPIVPAAVKFVDIAGLVKGAHKGEGLGNQFLSHIREVDVIVFVVRDFKSEDVIRSGSTNPEEDLEVLRDELLLKDLETIESQKSKFKSQSDNEKFESALERAFEFVSRGKWLADEFSADELSKIADLQLLSAKKFIIVLNSDEVDLSGENPYGKDSPLRGALRISAKLEEELAGLSEDEQEEYLAEMGISESGLERLIKLAYQTLGLATFYTAGSKEVRAWTIKSGSLAPQAAGVIHSDFERGFIAADIVKFDDFVSVGGWKSARDKGLVKTIGKSEVMPKDVVVEFKFSV